MVVELYASALIQKDGVPCSVMILCLTHSLTFWAGNGQHVWVSLSYTSWVSGH